MAIRPKKNQQPKKSKTIVDPEPEIDFEDETGATLDESDFEEAEEEPEEEELEVEKAKVARVRKDGLYVALKVVRVNPRGELPDKSIHVGDVQYVGGPPFKIESAEVAKELLRMGAIRPATEKDIRRHSKAA